VEFLLPLEIDIADVVGFVETELPELRSLSLVYPFTEQEIETLLRS